MYYPDKELVVSTLLETARRAGTNSESQHPEDIAVAMMNAVEAAATTIMVLHENDKIRTS